MKTKTIYLFDSNQNTIVKIGKKTRKRAKKIMKRRELEMRIIKNAEKAAEFDAYMANKIWNKDKGEKRPIVINLERIVETIELKGNSQKVSSTVICSIYNDIAKRLGWRFVDTSHKAFNS